MNAPERQTSTRIRQLLEQSGLRPRHDLGQNFLIDLNLLDLIVQSAELTPNDVILEVGTGTGTLTAQVAQQARHVVAVEFDPEMARLTAAAVDSRENVTLLNQDVLKNKNHIADEVLDAVQKQLLSPGTVLKLVANLPYHVATPVISNVFATDLPWSRMVVTIQWELAERMLAEPSTADYSALSVWLQSQSRMEIVRRLPPTVFWPRPKVDSAIVRIERDVDRQQHISDRAGFHEFLRGIFTQRRKHLMGVVAKLPALSVDRSVLETIHRELNILADIRAEALTVEQLVAYHNRLVQFPERGA
ncbi:MAG: 16S rRNA (adenine(1518)-N(6)/adenine(1519)-N(6))-dimethyltransferase RsmA [Planctomycetaceae bacterium]